MARFRGNPNVTISAIDTGGGIASSRTSGQTPCFVQVSASAITATGTSRPYEDLEYHWNFGDTGGTERFTRPDGVTVNANVGQYGPEAAYVYREAGTYTVTLTIRGKNGSGGYTETQVTEEIEVTAFSGTDYYYDSVGGSDSNNGLSPETPKQTLSGAVAANRRINLKRGGSWTGQVNITHSPLRIQAYGTGDKPVLQVTAATTTTLFMWNGGAGVPAPKSDVAVSDTVIRQTGGGIAVHSIANTDPVATIDNFYLDNCDVVTGVGTSIGVLIQGVQQTKSGLWNCTITGSETEASGQDHGMFASPSEWFFTVGGSISGAGENATETFNHHIYPNVLYHLFFKWIAFGDGPGRAYCINTNYNQVGEELEYAEYVLISECTMTGTARAFDASNGNNDPSESRFRNFVAERCYMHDLTGDGVILFYCAETMTVRDCKVWDCDGGRWFAPDAAVLDDILTASLYRNEIYRQSGSGAVISYSGTAWTTAQTITDNVIVDIRSSAQLIGCDWTDHDTESLVDRNQYYAPNDSTPFIDVSTGKSFADWQAAGFDPEGSYADPAWIDPANGVFSVPAGKRTVTLT